MRRLDAAMAAEVVAEIDARLAGVAAEHGVAIPWAIESGSRAWGFPSPDSDYDCRFLFVRPQARYAALWRPRDVIETPLDAVFDVNGWDLAKAVRLAVGGNATVGEWLRSPLVYQGVPEFRDELTALVDRVLDVGATVRHYLHLGRRRWPADAAEQPMELKRIFYALRPAAVLHWMRAHGLHGPPMTLPQLFAEATPPSDVAEAVAELTARKAETRELGVGIVPEPISRFVDEQFAAAEELPLPPRRPDARAEAAAGFARLVARWAPR